ncbi:MAG TPA: hypothetical protein VNO50_22735 [Pyrinomonadaceae bacterium]|nr:hypothetical protein [Pyrinomonadaceae bacterium]
MSNFSKQRFRLILAGVIGFGLLLVFWFQAGGSRRPRETAHSANGIARLPPTILWAWVRPEKLDFIDREKVGVAFLAKTIYLRGDQTISRPRLQPLATPLDAPVIAVARIEADRTKPANLSEQQLHDAAREISELGHLPNVVMVQVDFDATTSERSFYRSLLVKLRASLPASTLLSITALASWCEGDNWLDDLPIDEAVPMLFRMGVERNQFLSLLGAGERFKAKRCQESVGISTDEPIDKLPKARRVYVFNPESWSPAKVKQVMEANAK